MYIIAINGTIGSGKTTLCEKLSKYYDIIYENASKFDDFNVYINNIHDKNIVLKFQKKINDILIKNINEYENQNKNIIILDRCTRGNNIFLQNFIKNEKLFTEKESFKVTKLNIKLQIYLKTNKSYERIKKRNRLNENKYTINYLNNLNDLYNEEFENDKDVIIINTDDKTCDEIYEYVISKIKKLNV